MDKDELAAKRITMRDAPIKEFVSPKIPKPLTTHDIHGLLPKTDNPEDPKAPGSPMITTGNVEKFREKAAMRARMEKARQAKMDKIKEEIEARTEAEEKKEKAKIKREAAIKAKSKEKVSPAEKKEPESPPETITEAVEKETKKASTRKSYSTKKKEDK